MNNKPEDYKIHRELNKRQMDFYCDEVSRPVKVELWKDDKTNFGIMDFNGIKTLEHLQIENGKDAAIKSLNIEKKWTHDESLMKIFFDRGYKIVRGRKSSTEADGSNNRDKKTKDK